MLNGMKHDMELHVEDFAVNSEEMCAHCTYIKIPQQLKIVMIRINIGSCPSKIVS